MTGVQRRDYEKYLKKLEDHEKAVLNPDFNFYSVDLENIDYAPNPDPKQERFFFDLVSECLRDGDVTEQQLRDEIANGHLRQDAFDLIRA